MARPFPYEDASVYMAWRSLRGQKYARQVFEGMSQRTFVGWEQRYKEDPKLQEMTERKRADLGLDTLRSSTVEFMGESYARTKRLLDAIEKADDPKMAAAYSDAIKALSMMANFAGNTLVDTEPMPQLPGAVGMPQ